MMGRYAHDFDRSLADPEGFWGDAAKAIDWDKRLGPRARSRAPAVRPVVRRRDAEHLLQRLDRHVAAGRGDQPALICDSPMTGRERTFTYAELRDEAAQLAGASPPGVAKGDRVVIYMPMVPEAAIAMLACARLGAIHSVVFGGFAAAELATRIADAQAEGDRLGVLRLEPGRVVNYKPLLDAAIALSPHKPDACLILQREQAAGAADAGPRPRLWRAEAAADAARLRAGRGHRSAVHSVHLRHDRPAEGRGARQRRPRGGCCGTRCAIYGVRRRRRVLGRVRCRLGGRPQLHRLRAAAARLHHRHVRGQAGRHARCRRVLAGHRAASGEGAVHRADRDARDQAAGPDGKSGPTYDLSALEALFLAGERCDPPTGDWAGELLGKPVVDHWWQTETGWAITAASAASVCSRSSPAPAAGRAPATTCTRWTTTAPSAAARRRPAICASACRCRPAARPTLWQNDDGYRTSYLADFPGWYRTGDAGVLDADGDVSVMGRTDDIINVAGHRLSTGRWRRCWPPIRTSPNAR